MIRVIILSQTENPMDVLYLAARTSRYVGDFDTQLKVKPKESEKEKLVRNLVKWGHLSILEHVSFVFGIEGISRVTSHQLVRHRLASYTQQSQRYASMKDNNLIIPPSIQANSEALEIMKDMEKKTMDAYRKLCALGIPMEDARYLLPHGLDTRIVMTMNMRELWNTCSVRLCTLSQWEILSLFEEVRKAVGTVSPFLASLLQAQCLHLGKCPEDTPCEVLISAKKP